MFTDDEKSSMLLVMRVLSIVPLNFKVTYLLYATLIMSKVLIHASFDSFFKFPNLIICRCPGVATIYREKPASAMVRATVTRTARVQFIRAVPHAGIANTP